MVRDYMRQEEGFGCGGLFVDFLSVSDYGDFDGDGWGGKHDRMCSRQSEGNQ